MPQDNQNFELTQGVDKNLVFTVKNSAGVAVNLTGATIFWNLMEDNVDGSIKLALASDSIGGITITTAASGIFTVAIADTDTILLSGLYYHEAKVIDSSGNLSLISNGWVSIKPARLT